MDPMLQPTCRSLTTAIAARASSRTDCTLSCCTRCSAIAALFDGRRRSDSGSIACRRVSRWPH
jgi:hypothetical protein